MEEQFQAGLKQFRHGDFHAAEKHFTAVLKQLPAEEVERRQNLLAFIMVNALFEENFLVFRRKGSELASLAGEPASIIREPMVAVMLAVYHVHLNNPQKARETLNRNQQLRRNYRLQNFILGEE